MVGSCQICTPSICCFALISIHILTVLMVPAVNANGLNSQGTVAALHAEYAVRTAACSHCCVQSLSSFPYRRHHLRSSQAFDAARRGYVRTCYPAPPSSLASETWTAGQAAQEGVWQRVRGVRLELNALLGTARGVPPTWWQPARWPSTGCPALSLTACTCKADGVQGPSAASMTAEGVNCC